MSPSSRRFPITTRNCRSRASSCSGLTFAYLTGSSQASPLRRDELSLLRQLRRSGDESTEGSRSEDRGCSVLLYDLTCGLAEKPRSGPERRWFWRVRDFEDIQEAGDQLITAVVMDPRVTTLVIAECFVELIVDRVEHDNLVRHAGKLETACQPKLERHVETRGRALATEVVNGQAAGTEKVEDSHQPPLALFLDLQNAAGFETEADESAYQRDEEGLVGRIVRRIEKNGLGIAQVSFSGLPLAEAGCASFASRFWKPRPSSGLRRARSESPRHQPGPRNA
jgi:hypothetical protein